MVPPAAIKAARAEAGSMQPVMTKSLERAPVPSIFTAGARPFARRTSPFARSVAGETVSPAWYAASSAERFTAETRMRFVRTVRARFLPWPRRFGSFLIRSRTSGRILCPARAVCPLPPRPEGFPRLPPRPTGGFFFFFVRGERVWSCIYKRLYCACRPCMCRHGRQAQFLESFNRRSSDGELVLGACMNLSYDVRHAGEVKHCTHRGAGDKATAF